MQLCLVHTVTLHVPTWARAHFLLCGFSLCLSYLCVCVFVCLFMHHARISTRVHIQNRHTAVVCIEQQDMSLATTVTTSTGTGPTSLVAEIGGAA